MRVEKLTAAIGAELFDVNLADAARDDGVFDEIRALLLKHKVLFLRDQDITRAEHVAFARRFGALEDHPVAGSDPDHPGLVRIYKDLNSPPEHYENAYHCDATWRAEAADGLRAALRRDAEVGGDTIWVNMAKAYEDLPEHIKEQIAPLQARHSIEATFGAAMPIEKRHALKAQFPDAEHPVVRTHPETGEKILFVNAFTTHFTNFHTPENVRFGQDYAPGDGGAPQLPDRPGRDPGIPGALALDEEQRRHLGQPLHAALRRPGLLARRPQDGARRHHRRPAFLEQHFKPAIGATPCNFSTTPCSRRTRTSWSSPRRPTAPNGRRATSRRTSR